MAEIDELPAATRRPMRPTDRALASGAGYDVLAYSDFLLQRNRPAEVLPLLKRSRAATRCCCAS